MTDRDLDTQSPLLTSSFRDRESAEEAYQAILARGYTDNDIHVLMTDDTHKRLFPKDGEKTELGHKALKGAAVGGGLGGALGATALGIAAATAAVTIPGVGLVIAGPLAGALAGGAAGATAGGLLGLLIGAGIPEERARLYEHDLRNGRIVLAVKPRDEADARFFEEEWNGEHFQR